MNIMGIGLPELAVIFLVTFLVLGPKRSISMARAAGQMFSSLKRTFNEVAAAASQEQAEDRTSPRDSKPVEHRQEPPPKTGDE